MALTQNQFDQWTNRIQVARNTHQGSINENSQLAADWFAFAIQNDPLFQALSPAAQNDYTGMVTYFQDFGIFNDGSATLAASGRKSFLDKFDLGNS